MLHRQRGENALHRASKNQTQHDVSLQSAHIRADDTPFLLHVLKHNLGEITVNKVERSCVIL